MAEDKDVVEKFIAKYRELVGAVIILMFSFFTFISALDLFYRRDMDAGFVMALASGLSLFLVVKLLKKFNKKRRSK